MSVKNNAVATATEGLAAVLKRLREEIVNLTAGAANGVTVEGHVLIDGFDALIAVDQATKAALESNDKADVLKRLEGAVEADELIQMLLAKMNGSTAYSHRIRINHDEVKSIIRNLKLLKELQSR